MQPLKAPENRESRKKKLNKTSTKGHLIKERCDKLYLIVVTSNQPFTAANHRGLQHIFVLGVMLSWTCWDSVQVAIANATAQAILKTSKTRVLLSMFIVSVHIQMA